MMIGGDNDDDDDSENGVVRYNMQSVVSLTPQTDNALPMQTFG